MLQRKISLHCFDSLCSKLVVGTQQLVLESFNKYGFTLFYWGTDTDLRTTKTPEISNKTYTVGAILAGWFLKDSYHNCLADLHITWSVFCLSHDHVNRQDHQVISSQHLSMYQWVNNLNGLQVCLSMCICYLPTRHPSTTWQSWHWDIVQVTRHHHSLQQPLSLKKKGFLSSNLDFFRCETR